MARNTITTYTCDQCGKSCTELYGPLVVDIRDQEMMVIKHADVCSWACAAIWITTIAENPPS